MICLACDELTKHKTQTIQKRVKQTVLDKIAPKDPTAKRPGFYVLLDKPVGGLPSNDGVGRHPVYINGDRLVTFAKMVGGIDDENILEMLRTAKGFRKLVHSVGVSIVGDLPDKVVTFTLGFSGELGSGGSRNSMKITTDGTEHIMVMDEQQWSDSDETPQEFLFELVKPKDIATATVKLYLNNGYRGFRYARLQRDDRPQLPEHRQQHPYQACVAAAPRWQAHDDRLPGRLHHTGRGCGSLAGNVLRAQDL